MSREVGADKTGGTTSTYVPSNLLLPDGLDLTTAERCLGGRKARAKLAAIVSRVVTLTARLDKEAERRDGFISIPCATIERLIGKRYAAPAMRALVASDILQPQISKETGKHVFSIGHFAKPYRLAPNLWERRLAFVPCTDSKLAERIQREREASNVSALCSDPVNTAILSNLGKVGVPPGFADIAADLAEQKGRERRDVALWQIAAHELAARQLWFSRTDPHSRAFHNLASLPKALRPMLTLDGEPVAEVDIANAQPLFLLSLYGPSEEAERRDFALTVGRGGFYEALFQNLPRPLSDTHRAKWGDTLADWKADPERREAFKTAVLTYVLYASRMGARGAAMERHPTNRAFARLFPALAATIGFRLVVRGGASDLAREMQRREAELVLGRVFPRILAELPECAPVSLHDAVLCQARFAPAVKQIVEEETRAVYGLTPTVRVK